MDSKSEEMVAEIENSQTTAENQLKTKHNRPTVMTSLQSPKEQKETYPFYKHDGYIMEAPKKEDEGEPTKVSRRIEIIENRMNIDTGEVTILLGFDYGNTNYTLETKRGQLSKRGLLDLADRGLDVGEHNAFDVALWLSKQEKSLPVTRTHSHLGFRVLDGKLIFRHAVAIGGDSTYGGTALIVPQGTSDEWMAVIQKEVLGHPTLELALVFGLAAPVASMIAKETGLEVLVLHLHGNSSMGKTTAVRVAVSPFGYPGAEQEGGLIKTWNATDNGLLGELRNNFGIPIGIDEASMREGGIPAKIIYTFASGRDKTRLQKTGEQQEAAHWGGVILSTAEHGLQEKSSKNAGIAVRVQEIGNVQWTASAKHADVIKEALIKNYGHAGPVFVKHLLELGPKVVMAMWREQQIMILQRIPNPDHFASRLADRLAIFAVTADLAKDSLGLELNKDDMLEILLKSVSDTSENRDIGRSSYEYFLEALVRHSAKFADGEMSEKGYEFWGKQIKKGGRVETVYIIPQKFRELMTEGGYDSPDVILREWRQQNLLDSDPGKNTRKKMLNGISTRVHVITIEQDVRQSEQNAQSGRISRVPKPLVADLFRDEV